MPNALLEVLAIGTPVVATDCPGGIREIQEAAGPIDLVPVEDAAALATAIISVLRQSVEHRRKAQIIESLGRFDPQQIAAEYSKLL